MRSVVGWLVGFKIGFSCDVVLLAYSVWYHSCGSYLFIYFADLVECSSRCRFSSLPLISSEKGDCHCDRTGIIVLPPTCYTFFFVP